jgi:hypothetical protein
LDLENIYKEIKWCVDFLRGWCKCKY